MRRQSNRSRHVAPPRSAPRRSSSPWPRAPLAAQTPAEIQAALDAAFAKYKDIKEGANADYIPALAKVDSKIYGIAAGDHGRQGLHRR